ncbi:PIN domain-containing protein [Maridesulfovibrio sp. FT414]|uniref:PIN domain-containing protein n=1 Tax=Maridesulfovibrio sp. FT414 TaxID=2979469 RepID=UPI003D80323C
MTAYSAFKKKLKVEMISSNDVSPRVVFDRYFNQEPPFKNTKKKKAEFPDAFAIQTLVDRFQDEPLVVFSTDNDWKSSFEKKKSITVLRKLIELFEMVPEEVIKDVEVREKQNWAMSVLDDCWEQIEEKLHQDLLAQKITVFGAKNVDFNFIELIISRAGVSIIGQSNDNAKFLVSVDATFHAMASYDTLGVGRVTDELIEDTHEIDVYVAVKYSFKERSHSCEFFIDIDVPSVLQLDPYDECDIWCSCYDED